MACLLKGMSQKEVVKLLDIAENTVHYHVTRIYKRLGVHSRAELLSLWINRPAGGAFYA